MKLSTLLRALADRLDPQPARKPGLCTMCGKQRHRTDKVTYLAWKHDNCEFPQGAPLPEPLGSMIETREML